MFIDQSNHELTVVEENSEVNSFLGWAIFSAMKRFKEATDDEKEHKEILSSLLMREREIDDAYMEKCYDSHMAMLNRGGLMLVKGFFRVGEKPLHSIRDLYLRWRQSTEIQKMHLLLQKSLFRLTKS